ncbi:N-acetylmuramoyl-L-alanine amidase [Mucisphaera calidilacus]|uniref:N-acetylmuramoyl-L-alanine amidase n=1 Tax=Mucisphaera calidilacus TaxID=2527982 RepID=A0A518BWJ4_9BACT|nr:peptidoglycan recognition family protein [Mucisphaera calidilacus]QDU71331.1 N-acetyl-anhydromuranmyl-L-alanine amidase [Mucisphaera calidilacus]
MPLPARMTLFILFLGLTLMTGCSTTPGTQAFERKGDEIVAAGHYFHTGAPVVLWTDPGGYDAYRVERRFVPWEESDWDNSKEVVRDPNRFGLRHKGDWPEETLEQIRGGGWDLPLLQRTVDQFVIHYDVCGTSQKCFDVLHDRRCLSVHFMLDIDGTIYQTLDLKERAWHAGHANDRSVGIEIANMGAYRDPNASVFSTWYGKDAKGRIRITIPESMGDGGVRTPDFIGYPSRPYQVEGPVQGETRYQYDLTDEQYDSLIKLTAALHKIFPLIELDYPRGPDGKLTTVMVDMEDQKGFRGLIGHYHLTDRKQDPGPAFDWDRVVKGAKAELK